MLTPHQTRIVIWRCIGCNVFSSSNVVHLPCVVCVATADLSTADPSLGLDGLYTVLGLLLGVNAFNERTALMKLLEQRAGLAAEDGTESSDSK